MIGTQQAQLVTTQLPRIDLKELENCLEAYWEGTINDVTDHCLTNLSGRPDELIPGNPLLSQVDGDAMELAFYNVGLDAYHILREYWIGSGVDADNGYYAALCQLGHAIIALM